MELQTCRRGGFPGMKLMLSNPSTALCRQGWLQSSCTQLLNPCTDQMQGWGLGHARRDGLCKPHGDRRSLCFNPQGSLGSRSLSEHLLCALSGILTSTKTTRGPAALG